MAEQAGVRITLASLIFCSAELGLLLHHRPQSHRPYSDGRDVFFTSVDVIYVFSCLDGRKDAESSIYFKSFRELCTMGWISQDKIQPELDRLYEYIASAWQ